MGLYRGLNGEHSGMQLKFSARLTIGVIAALATATTILYSLVFISIQPASLSAAMPSSLVAGSND
jgi:hypothetical protein